jgi:hypothetical protein
MRVAILLVAAFAAMFGCMPCAIADEPVTIPLKEIWAYRMPGTQEVDKLDDGQAHGFLVEPVLKTIKEESETIKLGSQTEPGKGLAALQQLYRIRVAGFDAPTITVDDDVSVIFISYYSQTNVELHKVQRTGNLIQINYRFQPKDEKGMRSHFALIPFGKLPAGKYHVKIEQSPMEQKNVDLGYPSIPGSYASQIICLPFDFSVVDM